MLHAETFSCSSKNLPAGIAVKYGLSDRTLQKYTRFSSSIRKLKRRFCTVHAPQAPIEMDRNGSDIDLTFCGEGLTHSVLSKIDTDLDDLLLPYTIDLSVFRVNGRGNTLSNVFKKHHTNTA